MMMTMMIIMQDKQHTLTRKGERRKYGELVIFFFYLSKNLLDFYTDHCQCQRGALICYNVIKCNSGQLEQRTNAKTQSNNNHQLERPKMSLFGFSGLQLKVVILAAMAELVFVFSFISVFVFRFVFVFISCVVVSDI